MTHAVRDDPVHMSGGALRSGSAPLAIAIGRNEGVRLITCLEALHSQGADIIYVDSGSTDGSVEAAETRDAGIVQLDMSRPFTAARARNAGYRAIQELQTSPYVQFVDGDCEFCDGWLAAGRAFLDTHPDVAIVHGVTRERHPEKSIYNRLQDWEWEMPVGEVHACTGNIMVRTEAFEAVGGFNDDIIAAEDDDLCIRLRQAGWKIWHLDVPMAVHDVDIHRIGPWWRRAVRAGHAFADIGARHPDYFVPERRRVLFWGGFLPVLALTGSMISAAFPLAVIGLYLLSFLRSYAKHFRGRMPARDGIGCAALLTISKFPNLQGMVMYWIRRLRGRRAQLIEYK